MSNLSTENRRIRKNFGRHAADVDVPNLLDVQLDSFSAFVGVDDKENSGLSRAFRAVFPIISHKNDVHVEFVTYRLEPPVFTARECIKRARTYSSVLYGTFRVSRFNPAHDLHMPFDVICEEVYLGELPMMTENGSFVINGVERVVISQVHKSPGIYFVNNAAKADTRLLPSARIIPYFGSWLDIEFDNKDRINFRLNKKKKKTPVSTLFYAMGYSRLGVLKRYYQSLLIQRSGTKLLVTVAPAMIDKDFDFEMCSDGKIVFPARKRITKRAFSANTMPQLELPTAALHSFVLLSNAGRLESGDSLSGHMLSVLPDGVPVPVLYVPHDETFLYNTYNSDKARSTEEALLAIYRLLKPGDPNNQAAAQRLFDNLFFVEDKYDLLPVGRMKMNSRLGFYGNTGASVLQPRDIFRIVEVLIDLKRGRDSFDDIDNMSNRRVRSVGEILENNFRYALMSAEKQIRERSVSNVSLMPKVLFSGLPITGLIRNFFNSSQLSQFTDQINPLSEITHKRRISALGEGGISRERAGFEIRDVHATHYGRLCPIETPEGGNIGLINSLALYAKVDQFGFIRTPYNPVIDGVVQNSVEYLEAREESDKHIAQVYHVKDGHIINGLISCRTNNEVRLVEHSAVDYVDISAQQTVSAAAALIPFLEHDDANRALMGSNMQRQAVPLIYPEAPLIGTGVERKIVKESGAAVIAKRAGRVIYADANRVIVRVKEHDFDENSLDVYRLVKYTRSNQGTCINQRLIVSRGDYLKAGDVIADGCSTDMGELALGQNMLVAFMPWNGYNFEDSILISERVVQEDRFTSIHIEELVCVARNIPMLGDEEITNDIPNVSVRSLGMLDNSGIVPVGTVVRGGDILVGKVTPKQEDALTPEERLLHTLFGKKAENVKDTSLRLPANKEGVVVDVVVFESGSEPCERYLDAADMALAEAKKDIMDKLGVLRDAVYKEVYALLRGKTLARAFHELPVGTVLTPAILRQFRAVELFKVRLSNREAQSELADLQARIQELKELANKRLEVERNKIQTKDSLPKSTLKIVKVYVAIKRRIQPGDKLAGRHGNKGCISAVMPVEDMPFLKDGTPVDIVLNPLGVPSRMNIGQILETHLGLVSKELGKQIRMISTCTESPMSEKIEEIRELLHDVYNNGQGERVDFYAMEEEDLLELAANLCNGVPMASPVFEGVKEEELRRLFRVAGFTDTSGQFDLYDGRTGDKFDRKVTVGYMYMLKLNHLVDEKMHARSTGPYSMVTQQPLGGKAQFGGQRFGEMEVWALEAYGAAHILQEILTVKSDDVSGRYNTYKAIIDGRSDFQVQVSRPESFNVLLQEIKALGMNVTLK